MKDVCEIPLAHQLRREALLDVFLNRKARIPPLNQCVQKNFLEFFRGDSSTSGGVLAASPDIGSTKRTLDATFCCARSCGNGNDKQLGKQRPPVGAGGHLPKGTSSEISEPAQKIRLPRGVRQPIVPLPAQLLGAGLPGAGSRQLVGDRS